MNASSISRGVPALIRMDCGTYLLLTAIEQLDDRIAGALNDCASRLKRSAKNKDDQSWCWLFSMNFCSSAFVVRRKGSTERGNSVSAGSIALKRTKAPGGGALAVRRDFRRFGHRRGDMICLPPERR